MLNLHSKDLINGVFHLNQEIEGEYQLVSTYLNVTAPKYAPGSDQLIFAFTTGIVTTNLTFTANEIYAFATALELSLDLNAFFVASGLTVLVTQTGGVTVHIRHLAADNLVLNPNSSMLPHLVVTKVNLGYDIEYTPAALAPVTQMIVEFGNGEPQASSFDRFSVVVTEGDPTQRVLFQRVKNMSVDTFVIRDSLIPMPVRGTYHMLLRQLII